EIAQSESYTDQIPFSRFWLHNGMLRLGAEKMSKSLGNIISLPEALEFYDPQSLRLFFLSSHYRSPLFYSEESVRSQERAMQRLRQAANAPSGDGPQLDAVPFRERFIEAMDDDLNTPRALASLFDLVREINRGRESGSNITTAQDILRELAGVLGLELDEPQVESAEAAPFIQTLVDVRAELRGARQFQLADSIRDRLTELGVTLEDNPEGTIWRLG
ncbi:MAG: cysteine--tRNA ligase, partial [Dehalococcoidia bacterium]|nr:cysteine--tRNA ligase [Dehalococcoidia bacterium]